MITESEYNLLLQELDLALCVAISKKQSCETIEQLFAFGHRHFGENYLQELRQKRAVLSGLPITWHFTGRLQSRKCRELANMADWIHSIASIKHLQLLELHRSSGGLRCLLQVIPDGYNHEYALSFLDAKQLIKPWKNLEIAGIMVMPSPGEGLCAIQQIFQKSVAFAYDNWSKPVISMGMSLDYKEALSSGSNVVRLGKRIFSK